MPAIKLEELQELLAKIFIFDDEFIEALEEELISIASEKYAGLYQVLEEAMKLQEELVAKKLDSDPAFANRLLTKKQTLDKAALTRYTAEFTEKDQQKIQHILTKIKDL